MTIAPDADVFAIIPARGGSKGIPRKNLRPLAGRPLIAWTIEAVRDTDARIRCVVTTDDDEIAQLAERLGAEVVHRPSDLATDESPTEPAMLHALECLYGSASPQSVLLLQATSPIRLPGTIDRAIAEFSRSGADCLVGVIDASPFLWRGPTGQPTALYDPSARPRRQDLASDQHLYRETGSLYLTRTTALRESGNRISGRIELFVMADIEGADIDTEADFADAERMMRSRGHAG